MRRSDEGFTIVETLITIALLGILLTAVAIPLLSFNATNTQSTNSLAATSDAQKQLEKARTYVLNNYSNAALLSASQLSPVTCTNLNALGNVMALPDCTVNNAPPMRRLSISKTVVSQTNPVVLSLDVRP